MITEPHFTPGQLAERWSVSPDWIRRRFRREHGVVRLGSSWRIPASVAVRHSTTAGYPGGTALAPVL